MTTSEIPADQLLQQLFDAVVEEARSNPAFADRLIAALAGRVAVRTEAGGKKAPKPKEEAVLLTRLFNQEGEEAVRTYLRGQKPASLRALVKRQHIPVEPEMLKGKAEVLHDAIVEGVKLRIADRLAAAS